MTDYPQQTTRMTADAYRSLPESTQPMELINGAVVMSPSPVDQHQKILIQLVMLLQGILPDGELRFAPADVYLDESNIVQPDLFWVSGESDRCHLRDNYWHGAPDLIAEVLSPSTASRDRGIKFDLYEQYGVREYWLIDPTARFIEVYAYQQGGFARVGLFEVGKSFLSSLLNHEIAVDQIISD